MLLPEAEALTAIPAVGAVALKVLAAEITAVEDGNPSQLPLPSGSHRLTLFAANSGMLPGGLFFQYN